VVTRTAQTNEKRTNVDGQTENIMPSLMLSGGEGII